MRHQESELAALPAIAASRFVSARKQTRNFLAAKPEYEELTESNPS
jgi:hypothetical protein